MLRDDAVHHGEPQPDAFAFDMNRVQLIATPGSYPGIRGQYGTRGWELVRELDLPGNAARIAEEARQLLTADECPALDATDLILGSEQMALQIHESVGHATELDRILGTARLRERA